MSIVEELRANLTKASANLRRLRENRQWLQRIIPRVERNLERVKESATNRRSQSAEKAAVGNKNHEWVWGQTLAALRTDR